MPAISRSITSCRRRAPDPVRCGEQPAFRVRQALVRRRSALARRIVPRRGRVCLRQRLSTAIASTRRGEEIRTDPFALQPRSVRASAHAEGEGTITTSRHGAPKFEGNVTLSRPVGTVLASGRTVRERALAADAQGQGERGVRLVRADRIPVRPGGTRAEARAAPPNSNSARSPRIDGVLSAGSSTSTGLIALHPYAAACAARSHPRAGGEFRRRAQRLGFRCKSAFSVDTVTLGGAPLQNLRGDLTSDGDGCRLRGVAIPRAGIYGGHVQPAR